MRFALEAYRNWLAATNIAGDVVFVWVSIVLESLPFVVLGAALAAALECLVPPDRLERMLRSSGRWGMPLASLVGLVVPVCDCAVFPVVRKLLSKGWTPSHAVAFLCASSSLSPAVVAATWWAFPGSPFMALARAATGVLTGIVAGAAVARFWGGKSPLKGRGMVVTMASVANDPTRLADGMGIGQSCDHGATCGCTHGAVAPDRHRTWIFRIQDYLDGLVAEFSGNMVYILAGSFVAALVQVLVPHGTLESLAGHPWLAVPAMMAWGFCLCICAHADAFVAASFSGVLPVGALLAFMSFGGILDARNLLLWWGSFHRRFVLVSAAVVFAVVLAVGCILSTGGSP